MLNVQVSMVNECINDQWSNALNIEYCKLIIVSGGGL
jgi:hypothetical protein